MNEKTLRDEYAMAALTGLLAHSDNTGVGIYVADRALEIADWAMALRSNQPDTGAPEEQPAKQAPEQDARPLNLGEFIDALERVGKDDMRGESPYVCFRFANAEPGDLTSYRGHYDQLALATGDKSMSVDDLVKHCTAAVGETFNGYKGGSYTMTRATELYVANWGKTSDTRIVGVSWEQGSVIAYIETAEFPDW